MSTAGSGFDTVLGLYTNNNGLLSGAVRVRVLRCAVLWLQCSMAALELALSVCTPVHPSPLLTTHWHWQIASDDDCSGVLTSCITFTGVMGQSYAIQAAGYNGAFGSLSISLTALAPANDNFARCVKCSSDCAVMTTQQWQQQ